ncbi:U-box domain-containing protein 33 [Vitis vinifera]|uniref:RING-type E3 ubiquitin transferase n=1 Tax=Vitis vinifera TaxID=29760 RepID=A0A438EH87_VITVI|nr:U-box domain-containing protein 33 [Vitis vinifera]
MAVVSPVPAISQQLDHVRLHEIGVSAVMSSTGEIVEEQPLALVVEDKIFVAVGKEVKESKSILVWALQNSGGKRISIVHVHQPAQMIPITRSTGLENILQNGLYFISCCPEFFSGPGSRFSVIPMGGKFPASKLKEQEVKAYRDLERQDMHKILNDYLLICRKAGVRAEKLYIESENVEKGILELISEHGIKKLVVGAAADKHYSRRMLEPKSKKAAYVRDKAPLFCHILVRMQGAPHLHKNHPSKLVNPGQDLPRTMSVPVRITVLSSPDGTGGVSAPWSRMGREGSSDYWDGISKRSPSQASGFSTCSSGDMAGEVNEDGLESRASPVAKQALHHSSPPSVLEENIYDQLEQAMVEAENSRREAFQESLRRSKAEKDAIEAIRRAKEAERSFSEELKLRRDIEEALQAQGKELESLRNKQQEIMEELKISLNHKSLLENQIADSEQIERDNAIKTAEELKKKGASTSHTPQYFAEFSFAEIEKATQNFDPSVKIGEGGYGSIYKGCLRHTQVAIRCCI